MNHYTKKQVKETFITSITLLIICILFGLLVGCEKTNLMPIKIDNDKIRKCLDCKIEPNPTLDTIKHSSKI